MPDRLFYRTQILENMSILYPSSAPALITTSSPTTSDRQILITDTNTTQTLLSWPGTSSSAFAALLGHTESLLHTALPERVRIAEESVRARLDEAEREIRELRAALEAEREEVRRMKRSSGDGAGIRGVEALFERAAREAALEMLAAKASRVSSGRKAGGGARKMMSTKTDRKRRGEDEGEESWFELKEFPSSR